MLDLIHNVHYVEPVPHLLNLNSYNQKSHFLRTEWKIWIEIKASANETKSYPPRNSHLCTYQRIFLLPGSFPLRQHDIPVRYIIYYSRRRIPTIGSKIFKMASYKIKFLTFVIRDDGHIYVYGARIRIRFFSYSGSFK